MADLSAPFPWFGGKATVADLVWSRFGRVPNYVEPFAGSLAVLLGRPADHLPAIETVNDLDGFICNVWRAIAAAPDLVAQYADWPVNENDLHARHAWLVGQRADLSARLEGDPDYFDAKIAGWWLWGICMWIGSGWCSGRGPWRSVGGRLVKDGAGAGVARSIPILSRDRQVKHFDAPAPAGVSRSLPVLVARSGVWGDSRPLRQWMLDLSDRLRRVRVCSGDWLRVCGSTPTYNNGLTGVFLDPPYADTAGRAGGLYAVDSLTVAHAVREWAISNGDNSLLRIAVCGYDGEHNFPDSWECVAWRAIGRFGYGNQNANGNTNSAKERIWFSPHCLKPADAAPALFDLSTL